MINKMSKKENSIISFISNDITILLYSILSFVIILFFLQKKSFNIALVFILLYWFFSLICLMKDRKKNAFIIVFFLSIFVFILSRPTISFIRGEMWWYFTPISVSMALLSIFISMVFLLIGNKISYFIKIKKSKSEIKNKDIIKKISTLIFIALLITFLFNGYVEIKNYLFMRNYDYAYVYTSVAPSYNIVITVLSSLFIYIAILYLSTLPKKKYAYFVLILLIVTSIPSFLLGSRNVLVLRVVFTIMYVFLRNIMEKKEKWINKKMIIGFAVFIPIFFVFMGAYNYIRDSKAVSFSPIVLVEDTLYKQGTTFDTICEGFEYEGKLQDMKQISYTFGDVIDYLLHNKISNKLFKTKVFPNGNSMEVVYYGNSMAHKLSYLVLGKKSYLSGHGRGTSYLIETYMDGSLLWLEVYSLLIGLFLSCFNELFDKKNVYVKYILLLIILEIFLLPRYSASGFISFIFKPYFLITIIAFYTLSKFHHFLEVKHEKK